MVMKALRQSTKPIIWIVAFAFVGTIFLAWGMDFTRRPGEKGIIGTAMGQDIPQEDYQRVVDRIYYQQSQQNPGKDISEQETRQMRDQAFNSLVQDIIFRQERSRLGLTLSDDELVEHMRRFPPDILRNHPSFMTDGSFDANKYLQAMLDPQLGPFWVDVESYVRPQLEGIKLQEYVISLARTSDPEVKLMFESAQEKRKVRYVSLPVNSFVSRITDIDSAMVRAYYEEHTDDYYKEDQVELSYVSLLKDPSREDTSVVINDLNDVRIRVQGGEDFNELARGYSDEPSAAQSGGDLGWFKRGQMVPAFDSTVFSMEPGTMSEPVLTRFGYHLIFLHDRRTVNDSDEVHASHILMKLDPSGRTLTDIRLKAQQFIEDLATADFDSLATEYGLTTSKTGKVVKGGSYRGLGRNQALDEFAFSGKVGDISNVVDQDKFLAICKIDEMIPAGHTPIEDIWRSVEFSTKSDMAADSALAELRKVEREVENGKSLTDGAATHEHEVKESDFFGRFESVPGIGSSPAFHGVSFSLTGEEPTSPAFRSLNNYCIVELVDVQESDPEVWTTQRDSLYTSILNSRQGQVYQLWYEDMYTKAEIEDYRYQISQIY